MKSKGPTQVLHSSSHAFNTGITQPGPQHTLLDTDAHKFLIDSGVSTHKWNQRKEFLMYKQFSKEDQKKEQVLGISSDMIQPLGVGTIHVEIEDDLNAKHTIELHDVMHMPDAPINILVPQVFIQQHQSKGDAVANCSILAIWALLWNGLPIQVPRLSSTPLSITAMQPLPTLLQVSRILKPLHHCVACQPMFLITKMIQLPPCNPMLLLVPYHPLKTCLT